MEINPDNLEDALNSAKNQDHSPSANQDSKTKPGDQKVPNSSMTPQEEIGFHKGALSTLIAERNELVKMIGNVNAIMQAHIKRLEELGVKIK
ncbi:hypothetical protein D6829_02395 [Candidatus Pacearchaeota archaeon]|nr:MAG: hypothetical protein D6829_02395 [Candidatus Pacearchaeota archaeon]